MGSKVVLILTILIGMSVYVHADEGNHFIYPQDSVIYIDNNQLLLSYHIDTIITIDPITSAEKYTIDYEGHRPANETGKTKLHLVPVQLNGNKIFSPFNNSELLYYTKLRTGEKYLIEHLQRKMNRYCRRLNKAGYNADIRNIVVNTKGKIIYYEYSGVYKRDTFNPKQLKQGFISRINTKAKEVLNDVELMPAKVDQTVVAYRINHYELL